MRGALGMKLAHNLFCFGFVNLCIMGTRCWAASRLHRATTNNCAPTRASAKFSKCHPNGHNRFPAFDLINRQQTACQRFDHCLSATQGQKF
jgi:hypothetical protein